MLTKKIKTAFAVIAVNVLLLAVGLCLIEVLLIGLMTFPKFSDKLGLTPILQRVHVNMSNVVQNTDCGKFDPGLFYTLRPGQCTFASDAFKSLFNVKINVNSLGVRDEESALAAPEIVALGDSVTMGWGVAQDEPYPRLLSELAHMKVLNAAVSSYGTAREMKMLERIDTSHMKYLMIQWCSNDQEENLSFLEHGDTLIVSPEVEFYTAYMVNKERSHYYFGKIMRMLLPQVWENTKILAQRLWRKKPAQPAPAPTSVAAQPDPQQALMDDYADAMLRTIVGSKPKIGTAQLILIFPGKEVTAAVRENIKRHPEYPGYIQKAILYDYGSRTGKEDCFVWDEHFNPKGHTILARDLASLIKTGALPRP
jgi:lysophospholipase L1-like esterase